MTTANQVLMIRPAAFGSNPETAESNTFQQAADERDAHAKALTEFEAFAAALRQAGIGVQIVDDTPTPTKPDAVFPNNWVSFHEGGRAVLYPMASPLRQNEVRPEIVEALGYRVVLDLRDGTNEFLEGTGSLVLDRVNRLAYACRSPRTSERLVHRYCEAMGYEPVLFDAFADGKPIYHTNVMLAVGESLAVVCLECCDKPDLLAGPLIGSGKQLVEISLDQMRRFSGNMLQLQNREGERVWVMSDSAWSALEPNQRNLLETDGRIVTAALPTIEKVGGGSARCMLAELY